MGTEPQLPKKPKDEEIPLKFSWKPEPIVAEEIIQQPILEKAFVGILKDKKSISKAILNLTSCLPSPQHLKRCSGLRIYLATVNRTNGDPEALKSFLSQEGFDLSLLEDNLEVIDVCAQPPKTKAQMVYASKFWPVNFHPDLRLEALISGSLFDESQLASLETCMRLALRAAEAAAVGSADCNGSTVLVNPDSGAILAIAASRTNEHPMWHASMLAIDLVAKLQGGGAWKLLSEPEVKLDKQKRESKNELPLCYPDSLARLQMPIDGSLVFNKTKEVDDKGGPYLCTGYWAILLQEPCPLCAMALLHSRVTRIFYGVENPRTGVLGSKAVLHAVPGLNHRYQVWKSVLKDECMKMLEKCQVIDS